MPTEIYLVKVGMNMTEGIVEEWYIPDGGTVTEGELLYRLETEKVNLDVDAEASGTVRHLVAEGVTMEPGDVVGYIYAAGEDIPDVLPGAAEGAASAVADTAPAAASPTARPDMTKSRTPSASADGSGRLRASPIARRLATERGLDLATLQGTGPGGRIVEADVLAAEPAAAAGEREQRSSPMARKVARELGVDLDTVTGSGPGGRVTREDVESAARAPAAPRAAARAPSTAPAAGTDRRIPFKGIRKTVATRMHQSLQATAQLTMDMDVAMDEAVRLRSQLVEHWAEDGIRPTYTDLVIRAVARALGRHPLMNSQIEDSDILIRGDVHVGMAVALEEGLIVPVIRHADRLSLADIARESARLAAAARDGTLTPDDLQDGTFTVTALGMFGVDSFTPILNSPQSGILGVNRIRDDTAWENDKPVRVQRMRLSLTWDHQVLDGAPAAHFLAEVRDLLEAPYRLLI
ncbi:MAG: dihydrolipoamide acetyltransferase family protein [Pseudomonadales bacterium]